MCKIHSSIFLIYLTYLNLYTIAKVQDKITRATEKNVYWQKLCEISVSLNTCVS